MSDPAPLDLAKLDHWFGLKPSMTRAQALATLKQHGAETSEYGTNNVTASTDAWEMECYFATDGSDRLRQLSVEADEILWSGKPLIGLRVDDALRVVGSPATAVWAPQDAIGEPFPKLEDEPLDPLTDEELQEEGTIWLPERGLGLVVCDGEVIGVVWRGAQDLPTRFAGPVTEAQRQLSRRPDLEDYLREKRAERYKLTEAKDPLKPVRIVLTVLTLAVLALIGKRGFEEMRLWNQAATLTGKLVAIESVPMKQFRDFLPPALAWVIPPQSPRLTDGYRIALTDPDEQQREVVVERGELYVPPTQPGEEVPLAFVAGNPPRIKGLSRARDSAFVDYMPWAIAVGILFLFAQFLLSILPRLIGPPRQAARHVVPKANTVDPDRPELR